MNRKQHPEMPGVPGQGETYLGEGPGSPWNPEKIASNPVTEFQERIDRLLAEAAASYTTELNPDGQWEVTVSEAPTSQAVETTTTVAGIQEKVVITESSPFGVSDIKSEEQETVFSATGTIFDPSAKPQEISSVETGGQKAREHQG